MSHYYFNPIAFNSLFCGILILFLGIFVWKKRLNSLLNFSWFLVCLNMFIWLFSDFLLFSTTNEHLGAIFSKLAYIGVTGIPFSNIYFATKVANIKIKNEVKIFLVALYAYLLIITISTSLCVDGFHHYSWGLYPKAGKYHFLYLIFWSLLYVYSLGIIIKKYKALSYHNANKLRILYTFFALFLGGLIGSIDFVQKYGIDLYPVGCFNVLFVIGFITYSILKHNLLDITIVVRKSLVYSLLMLILTLIYFSLILAIEWLFRDLIGYSSSAFSIVCALIIAILFNPLKNRIQSFIDRFVLGKTYVEIANENRYLRQELERSERLKAASTLALGLAHEVRNPLTTIKTFAEFLPEKYHDQDFLLKFSKIIPQEIQRINSIIKQLLDFSKPAAPCFQNTSIYRIIQEILIFLNGDLLKHKIYLNESFQDRNLMILADPDQIKQALLNILFNSIDAMSKGGTIEIKTIRTPNNALNLQIIDNGCGISKEDLKHIFDPFFSKKDSGTGLGLAITHQIIRNHNGTIKVESKIGKGTTFTITLPLI